MEIPDLKRYRPHITVALLLFFMAVALFLRIIPAVVTRDQAFYPIYDTDTWYNLRQIEVMVHHFPQYNWFDPMTAYPQGKIVDWGPGYPFVAALFCILTGTTDHTGIIFASGFVSPLMAAFMVPVIYCLGSEIVDKKTGLVAAGLIAVSSFVYFSYSSYGMVDHHIGEVLLSTLFFLTYLAALVVVGRHPPGRDLSRSTLFFCGLAALAGILYFVALITSTTVLLVMLIVAIYTFVQGVVDFLHGRDAGYLCILNVAMLAVASILLVVFGFRNMQMSVMTYSPGLVALNSAIAAGSVVLYGMSKLLKGKRTAYLLLLAGLILTGLLLSRVVPALSLLTSEGIALFSGPLAFSVGVEETLPWSFSGAFDAINVAIILTAGGFLVLGYYLTKRLERTVILFTIWSAVMLLLTIRFQRFQYYFTVNIVLLSALCITEPFRWDLTGIRKNIPVPGLRPPAVSGGTPEPEKQASRERPAKKKRTSAEPVKNTGSADGIKIACLVIVCLLGIAHAGLSLSQDVHYALGANDRTISPDWLDSLRWISERTPDPGIGYFDQYNSTEYTAPADSYGILASWDAGHWITFFSHRLPVTNPFQDNLAGKKGAAAFFLNNNETQAGTIRENFRARYVITDSSLAVDRFTNLVPWVSGSVDISRYIKWFLIPDPANPSHLEKIHLFDDGYFQTLAVRLYLFDGSLTSPGTAQYVQYTIRQPTERETADASGYSRIVTNLQTINLTGVNRTELHIIPEGPDLLPTTYAGIFSDSPGEPVEMVPALTHYRLVYESPSNASVIPFPESESSVLPGVRTVKVFKYVKGATITGEGIIEIPLVTNTGRTFTYRQESSAGKFIVPYSTQGNPNDVRATGPYHIAGTSRSFEVPEEAVINGREVPAQ